MEIIAKYFSDFTPHQLEQLEALHALYNDWNQKINVISRKDMEHFYLHHVLHSLSIATAFDFKSGTTVLDLGCGGGFPGVPLAIFFPEVSFLMVDSIRKKLSVIEAVAQSIGLENIAVRHSRAEDIKDRKFENIVSRAVAPLGDLWRWSKPLLKRYQQEKEDQPNGLICLKGGDLTKEIQESTCKPYIWEIDKIFKEQHFQEKFMLYQPLR
jgi:16S rRNA (guanine527-N7)-methyltransferase